MAAGHFLITLQRPDSEKDTHPVVVEWGSAGDLPVRGEGQFRIDADLTSALHGAEEDPPRYGRILGTALFGDVGVARTLAQARIRHPDRLSVLIFVEDRTSVAIGSIHWEWLCAPVDGDAWLALGQAQSLPFSLYIPSFASRPFPSISRDRLRALLLVASPLDGQRRYGLATFDVGDAVAKIRPHLGDLRCDVLAAVTGASGPATAAALEHQLTTTAYGIVHVVCHGIAVANQPHATLFLENDRRAADRIDTPRLVEILAHAAGSSGLPRLMFLAACNTANTTGAPAEAHPAGIAQLLVRELGIPAVVAMAEQVSVATAVSLSSAFYDRLFAGPTGEPDVALTEARSSLRGRNDVRVPVLCTRLRGQPLLTDEAAVAASDAELLSGVEVARQLIRDWAPVLLSSAGAPSAPLFEDLARTIHAAAPPERTAAFVALDTLCEEAFELSYRAVCIGRRPAAEPPVCPFPGLLPFGSGEPDSDPRFFFGRDALVAELLARLEQHSFVAVVGESGSGKSSLVRAGIAYRHDGQHPNDRSAVFTPGADPLGRFLTKCGDVGGVAPGLVVVDQFEELFTQCTDESVRKSFVEKLFSLPPTSKLVIAMRSDFEAKCSFHPRLFERIQQQRKLVVPMTLPELRRAMEAQVAAVGMRFEAFLPVVIEDDLRDEPGAMPLFQHALRELWKRRHGRWLRTAEYTAVGGIKEAIARTAESIYNGLSEYQKRLVRDIFVRLTRIDTETADVEERRDTRQRLSIGTLVPAGGDPEAVRRILDNLATARLVVTSRRDDGCEEVEVAHEAIIKYWKDLQTWLSDDRALLALRQDIGLAAQRWDAQASRDDYLVVHRGAALQVAVEARTAGRIKLNEVEAAYVDACMRLRRRTLRLQLLVAAVGLVIVAGVALQLFLSRQETLQEKNKAQAQQASFQAHRPGQEVDAMITAIRAAHSELTAQGGLTTYELLNGISEAAAASGRVSDVLLDSTAPIFKDASPVMSAEMSADGARIVTTTEKGECQLWDVARRTVIASLKGHRDTVWSARFSADGNLIVTAGSDGTARIWDAKTGEARGNPLVLSSAVRSASFSPNSRDVLTANWDGSARIWDLEKRESPKRVLPGSSPLHFASFSPDGTQVATAHDDGTIVLWDIRGETPAIVGTVGKHDGPVNTVVFAPNGPWLLTASDDQTARVWGIDAPSSTNSPCAVCAPHAVCAACALHTIKHNDGVTSAFWSNDGTRILTASRDTTSRLTDATFFSTLAVYKGHASWVMSARFSSDGAQVVTAGWEGTARIWSTRTGQYVHRLQQGGDTTPVSGVAWLNDERLAASQGQWVRIWDIGSQRELARLDAESEIHSVACSSDGMHLMTGSEDGVARKWDLESTTAKWRPSPVRLRHRARIRDVEFSSDNRRVVTAADDETAKVWDVNSGELAAPELRTTTHPQVMSGACSPDCKQVLVANWDNAPWIWDLATTPLVSVRRFGHKRALSFAAWSHDGSRVITAADYACIWDVSTGTCGHPLQAHDRDVNHAVFSPDDSRVVTSSSDGTAIIWDSSTGKPIMTLRGHAGSVSRAAFSPNGASVATAGNDGAVLVFSLRERDLLSIVCGAYQRTVQYSLEDNRDVRETCARFGSGSR